MDKLTKKAEIVNECRSILRKRISTFQHEVDEAQKSANEYGPPKDRYDPYRNQMMRRRDMYAKKLQEESERLALLDNSAFRRILSEVEFGSVVITSRQHLFVSVGLGRFRFEGKDYFAISPGVPLYLAMKGKQKGEKFKFRDADYTINEIF